MESAAEGLALLTFVGAILAVGIALAWWVAVALIAATLAEHKGFSKPRWFVAGLIFGPLGVLGAAGLPDRRPGSRV
ncbi:MAG: hypothetical protein OXF93_11460 [Acidobacteria bacterium]|nr:hypothetical protein [Acidobacteriota bacterium]